MQKKCFHKCCPLPCYGSCSVSHCIKMSGGTSSIRLDKKRKGNNTHGKHTMGKRYDLNRVVRAGYVSCSTLRTCQKRTVEVLLYNTKVALPEDSFRSLLHNMRLLHRQHCICRSATKPQHYGITIRSKEEHWGDQQNFNSACRRRPTYKKNVS